MKNIFFDTEFTGLNKDCTLISIGCVSDCGRTFYGENTKFKLNKWVGDLPKTGDPRKQTRLKDKRAGYSNFQAEWHTVLNQQFKNLRHFECKDELDIIGKNLRHWINSFPDKKIFFWSDVLAYDWVLFCELFGGAGNLPEKVYYIPFDLSTLLVMTNHDPDVSRKKLANELFYQYLNRPHDGGYYDEISYVNFFNEDDIHDALNDAKMVRQIYDYITKKIN